MWKQDQGRQGKLEGKLNVVLQNVATANIALSELIVAACKKASDKFCLLFNSLVYHACYRPLSMWVWKAREIY